MKQTYPLQPESIIVVPSLDDAFKITGALLSSDYVVMLSREDQFYVLSFVYVDGADRNGVVLMNYEDFEEYISNIVSDVKEEDTPDIASLRNYEAWEEGFNKWAEKQFEESTDAEE